MKKVTKNTNKNGPLYEHLADDAFYLFLKKEEFLFNLPHYHDSIELIYMMRGKTTVHLSGTAYSLSEGEIFFCHPQEIHFYDNPPGILAFCVVLSSKYTHDFRQIHNITQLPSFLRNKEYNEKIFELLKAWLSSEERTFLVDCAFANLVLDKIIKSYELFDQSHSAVDKKALEFMNYINERYSEDLTLESASKYFGYSKEHFSRVFKQLVGMNFLTFLNTTRIQKAREMLQDSENKRSITEICNACGFNSPATLYRNLKKNTSYHPFIKIE